MTSARLLLCAAASVHSLLPQPDAPLGPVPAGPPAVEHSAVTPRVQQIGAYVTTVLVPSLPDTSARAVIIRQPLGTTTLNLVLVTAETTPRDLLRALAILNRARRVQGERVRQELRASVMPMGGAGAERGNGHAEAERHLVQLRASTPLELPGIGRYPSLTSSLPVLR